MKKYSKKYVAAAKKVDSSKVYSIEEAVKLAKETSVTKFDSSVGVSMKLNVNPTLADQLIRGTISLPHGTGKTRTVLALTRNKQEEAKAAGADFVGDVDMLEKIKTENWFGFDVIVCTPDMMGELGKMGRLLGPKGLMPNPKTGTVTPEIGNAVKEIKQGKISYRVDKNGNLNVGCGRVSFSEGDLAENVLAFVDQIQKARPSTVKGTYVKTCVLHTTMGPGINFTYAGRN
ncbi:MAG: 50S ribosomal protein L1 [Bacillota bacterium]|nr:50S ribosomal protein L1 [Bacillota bacterium]